MQPIKRLLIIFIALVAAVQVMPAQDATIVFTPQWTAQAQFAGFYVAEAKGFFCEAGVKVKIEHPSVTLPAMSRLRTNASQATTLQLCQAMEIVDGGIPLVNIFPDIDEQWHGHRICQRQGSIDAEGRQSRYLECGLRAAGHQHEHQGALELRMGAVCPEHQPVPGRCPRCHIGLELQ